MKTQARNKSKNKSNPFKKSWNGIPAFRKKYEPEASLFNHFFVSIVWHIVGLILLGVLFTTLKIGENPLFKPKVKDIEFTLSDSAPRSTKTTYSGSSAGSGQPDKSDSESVKPTKKVQPNKKVKTNRFATIPTANPDDFSIPMPKIRPMSSGSGHLSRRAGSSNGGSSQGAYSDSDSGSGNGVGKGSGNGSGFDKTSTRKALSSFDISPYVNELKRNVRWNWKAPKGQDSKSVELFLRIAKDGRLVILNVKRTSEIGEVDNAALNAVRKTLPLDPLPSKYSKSYLDVVFTFNSNSSSLSSRY